MSIANHNLIRLLDKPGVFAYSVYKEISFFESDYCKNNLGYEGVKEDS